MFNLLICEDEALIRLGLEMMTRALELPIGEIFLAENGRQAMELMRVQKIHIVLTDIEMPEVTGLDFLKSVGEQNENVRRVIITGHRDFQYAQAAIHLGIDDFLLKPVDEDELRDVLKRCVHALEKQQTQARLAPDVLMMQLEKVFGPTLPARAREAVRGVGEQLFSRRAFVCLSAYAQSGDAQPPVWLADLLERQEKRSLLIPVAAKRAFAILNLDAEEERVALLKALRETPCPMPIHCAVSPLSTSLMQMEASARAAEEALCLRFFHPEARVIQASHGPAVADAAIKAAANALAEHVKHGFAAEAARNAEAFARLAGEATPCALASGLQYLDELFSDAARADATPFAALSQQCDDLNALLDGLRAGLLSRAEQAARPAPTADALDQAISFMAANFDKPISLQGVADRVSLNYAYLSTRFKERTGMNFSAYLQMLRVEKAKELLVTTKLKMHVIAQTVGFEDEKYFLRVFKRLEGVTPGEYRAVRRDRLERRPG